MTKKALVVLAAGFEDIEAITPIDILRRAAVNVVVAGVGGLEIKGARGIRVTADVDLADYNDIPDVIVIPGGSKGAENLALSSKLKMLIREMDAKKKLITSICASPAVVLAPIGVLDGKKATCYPGMEEAFGPKIKFSKDNVVQDGHIITSRGVATALEFSIKIVENLVGKDTADMIAKNILL